MADHSGTYTLRDVATTGDALVLYSPYLGTDEFFILENRWRGTSYDSHRHSVYQEGLALWHCVQDPALSSNWARRAVHLRRADPRLDSYGAIQAAETLFDGNDPDRGYTLSDDSGPQNLLFRPGLPSQIRVSNISGAGSTMTVYVTPAPEPGGVYATISEIDSVRVHAKGSGYGPPGQWLDEDGIPDGVEDANHDGNVDPGETDPRNPDTDADGIQDGTEAGNTLADVGADTDTRVFIPDADASTTTDPPE